HRNSIATFWPSTKPVSLSPCRNADSIGPSVTGDLALKYPMTGIGCCALAASGHDTAAPPSSVMNWRRFNRSNCIRSPPARGGLQDIELAPSSQRVSERLCRRDGDLHDARATTAVGTSYSGVNRSNTESLKL